MSSIFGSSTDQSLRLPPELQSSIIENTRQQQQQAQRVSEAAPRTAEQVQTGFGGFAPQLQTRFSQPQFTSALDSIAQAQVARGQQALAQGAAAQQQALANQFRQQPGVARALAAQSANRAALQANPLQAQALEQQRARQAQEFQLGQQSQQLSNAAALAQGQEQARLQELGNQAQLQQLGVLGAGQQAQQNLLSNLLAAGQATGTINQRQAGLFK